MSNLDLWWEHAHGAQTLPLVLAMRAEPEMVAQMINKGWLVDFNEVSSSGVPLIGHLYSRSPHKDDYSDPGGTSLDSALSSSRISDISPRFAGDFGPIVAFMINHGADPWVLWNFTSDDKTLPSRLTPNTPATGQSSLLHCAVAKSDLALVRALLSHPARPEIDQLSAYRFTGKAAQVRNANQSSRYIDPTGEAYASSGNSALPLLHLAANLKSPNSADVVRVMVQAGFDPNSRDILGRTPIFYARSKEMVSTLLDLGADPSVLDNKNTSLSKYWEGHLVTQKNHSDLYGLVISRVAKDLSASQLRELHNQDLLKALSSGRKVSVVNIFKKAKFTFDHVFELSGSPIKWDLLVPVLLRSDVEKSLPTLDWLFKKVDIERDLGEGFTSMGLALATPRVPVSTSLQSIKEKLSPQKGAASITRSVQLALDNGWGSGHRPNELITSYLSWALISQMREDFDSNSRIEMMKMHASLMASIPYKSETDVFSESPELSAVLLQSENLNAVFRAYIRHAIVSGRKTEYMDTPRIHYSAMKLSFDRWLAGDKSYATSAASALLVALASINNPSFDNIWTPGDPRGFVPAKDLRSKIAQELPNILLDVPDQDLELLSSYASTVELPNTTEIRPIIRVVQLRDVAAKARVQHDIPASPPSGPKM